MYCAACNGECQRWYDECPPICEYCRKPATGHYTRPDEKGRQDVCGACQEELEHADHMNAMLATIEGRGDYERDQMKDRDYFAGRLPRDVSDDY